MKDYVYLLLFLLGSLLACQRVNPDEINNLNNNRIGILGHGGLGFPSPENHLPINSRSSILQAVEGWQADGVEVDVRMSADSVLFLYHDAYLPSLTDCVGCVSSLTAEQLVACRYRQGFNTNIAQDEYLVDLESILRRFAQRRIRPMVYLDVKLDFPCVSPDDKALWQRRLARRLAHLIEQYQASDWTVVETSNLTFAEQLVQQNPKLRLIFVGAPDLASVERARNLGFFGLLFLHRDSDISLIQAAHNAGLQVVLWGVIIRRDVINAAEQSPDWMLTDNIPLTIEVLK